jgi:hypothetical protein
MRLLILFSNLSAVLSYLIVSTNAPLIDNALSSWDKAMGFGWRSLFSWMQNHLLLRHLLQYAYASLLPQLISMVLFQASQPVFPRSLHSSNSLWRPV